MAENLSERENVVEPADTAGSLESPGDTEAVAAESGRVDGAVAMFDTADRDTSALRRGEPDGALTAGDIPQQPGVARGFAGTDPPETGRRSATQALYELGGMPHATLARIRDAQAAQRRAARLGEHEVAQATAAAWNLLGSRAGAMDGIPTYGRTGLVAENAQVSSESAQAGLMQATLAKMAEMSMGGGAMSGPERPGDKDGPGEPGGPEQQDDQEIASEQAATGPSEKLVLTMRLNDLRYELTRTDTEFADEDRTRLQAEHDIALGQLRGILRDEMREERAATGDALREHFKQQEVDPVELSQDLAAASGVLGQMFANLADTYGENDPRTQEARERFEKSQIGAGVIYLYTRADAADLVTNFPDHDPTESELAAMALREKEHEFARQLAAHGTGSWQAQRALDEAYVANTAYRAAIRREFEAADSPDDLAE